MSAGEDGGEGREEATSIRIKSLVHDSGVCDERALSIVSLRALAALMRHDFGILRITRLV